jgi:hypothetical protein
MNLTSFACHVTIAAAMASSVLVQLPRAAAADGFGCPRDGYGAFGRAAYEKQALPSSAVEQGKGFRLVGARVSGRAIKKVDIPDPGDDLYDKMEQSLKIKVGNGGYRVSGERVVDVNWDASSAKVVEEWSLVNPLEGDEKPIQFQFQVNYLFDDSGAKISEIKPLSPQ